MESRRYVKWMLKTSRRYLYIILMMIFAFRMIAYAIGEAKHAAPEINGMEPVESDFPLNPCDAEAIGEYIQTKILEENDDGDLSDDGFLDTVNIDVPLSTERQDIACEIADKYEVPVELLYAIMYAESGYNSGACSYNGSSVGIMQINRINYAWLHNTIGISDLYDYRQNVTAGAFMISDLISRYGGYDKALICYKYGEAGAASLWTRGRSDANYVNKIMCEYYRLLRQ